MSDKGNVSGNAGVAGERHSFDDISQFVQALSGHMREFGLSSVDVELAGTRIRLRTSSHAAPAHQSTFELPARHAHSDEPEPPAGDEEDYDFVVAPMIGTYYAAPGPGEPDFVELGDEIKVGQTIAIIEAMKIMNEITADRAGIVQEIMVRNAQAVEYGQPLLRLSPVEDE